VSRGGDFSKNLSAGKIHKQHRLPDNPCGNSVNPLDTEPRAMIDANAQKSTIRTRHRREEFGKRPRKCIEHNVCGDGGQGGEDYRRRGEQRVECGAAGTGAAPNGRDGRGDILSGGFFGGGGFGAAGDEKILGFHRVGYRMTKLMRDIVGVDDDIDDVDWSV